MRYGTKDLPPLVLEMRDAMLAAVHSGRIEDLKIALELNELRPDLGEGPVDDPIGHWKKASADGAGHEILAIVADLLDAGYAVSRTGADIENNKVFVWPYFAEVPLDTLTPAQIVELMRLTPAAVAKEMIASKRYSHYRIGIGADGTWHFFRK